MDNVLGSFTKEQLKELQGYYNLSKLSPSKMIEMEHVPDNFILGENFTFEEYVKLVAESRDNIYWFNPKTEAIVITLYIFIIVFGLISNGMVSFVIFCKKKLHTTTNMLIINLAMSDIIMCVLCVPFTIVKLLLKNWSLGLVLCKLVPWLQGIVVFSSTLTITAIALDRYYTIVLPSTGGKVYKKLFCSLTITLIWFISGLICLPLMVHSKLEVKEYIKFVTFTMCIESWPQNQSKFIYASSIMLLQFIIPIAVLLIIHWKICNFLKYRIIRDPKSALEMNRAMKDAKRHRKNTTLLMAIAVMFALCWFPLTLLNLLADFNYKLFMFENFILCYAFAHIIAMFSACLNPVMYGWFNKNFRREFTEFVCFWKKSEPEKVADQIEEQIIVYKRQVSYKAIQTEVQPAVRKLCHQETSPSDKETEHLNLDMKLYSESDTDDDDN